MYTSTQQSSKHEQSEQYVRHINQLKTNLPWETNAVPPPQQFGVKISRKPMPLDFPKK